MKVSLNWIKQHSDVKLSDEEITDLINARIGAIEEAADWGERYKGIVIAEISEVKEHPSADKLGVYQVNIGDASVQVVAGDKTLKVGDKAAYIAPGLAVPSSFDDDKPFIIEKRDLRDQESNGMLGSAAELSINDDNEKVLVLDTDATAGSSFADSYELNDTIIEVENKALTHRPDTFGILGFAREVSGIQGIQFKSPDWYSLDIDSPASDSLPVTINNQVPEACPRYSAIAISGIKVKPSPLIMQSYLKRIGIKPVNNIVDTTNYLMTLSGQPIHAFDYDKVTERSSSGAQIVVRYPNKGEKIATLDGNEVEPHEKCVLICTDKEAIAIGGAIGGSDTEVDSHTKNVLLEVANFDLYSIRRTSMQHGIFTEAVTRYIRGQSPDQTWPVALQAADMVIEQAGGAVGSALVDDYQKPKKQPTVSLNSQRLRDLLGSDISDADVIKTLENVEMTVSGDAKALSVRAGFWRSDINIEEDLVEEVGKLNGYETLQARLPQRDLTAVPLDDLEKIKRSLKSNLVAAGANEVMSYNFVSEAMMQNSDVATDQAYLLKNALRPELQLLRVSLMPSLLSLLNPNLRQGNDHFALFEIGKSHNKQEINDEKLPIERQTLAFAVTMSDKIKAEFPGAPFYQAKKYLDLILAKTRVSVTFSSDDADLPYFASATLNTYHAQRRAIIGTPDKVIGVIGEFSDKSLMNHKIPQTSAGFEIDIEALLASAATDSPYSPVSRFQFSDQDVTYKVNGDSKVMDLIDETVEVLKEENLSVDVVLKDLFQAEKETTKNVTLNIRLQHYDRTLTTKEVNQRLQTLDQQLATKQKAERV